MTKRVTDKQQAVLECIHSYTKAKGFGPTVREIGQMLGLSSPSTVHVHLQSLEKKGMITRDQLKSRSILLTDAAKEAFFPEDMAKDESAFEIPAPHFDYASTNLVRIPLVGRVAAGEPILAEENIEDYYCLPTDLVSDSAGFMLRVRGNSMIEAGINDGDFVVVREQSVANNGDIVVALVEDGATVKRFYKERDHIRLQPENSSMEPIILTNCSLAGKVVAVFRRL